MRRNIRLQEDIAIVKAIHALRGLETLNLPYDCGQDISTTGSRLVQTLSDRLSSSWAYSKPDNCNI